MVLVWHCPECGYIIDDIVAEQLRLDYWCPRCQHKRISQFDIGMPDIKFVEQPDPADWWKV